MNFVAPPHLGAVDSAAEAARLLREQGFAVYDIGDALPWSQADPIFQGLRRIRGFHPRTQRKWRVDRSLGMPRDPDDGWLLRRPNKKNPGAFDKRKKPDYKNVFMFRPSLVLWLAARGIARGSSWRPFWDAQHRLWHFGFDIACRIARELDIQTNFSYGILDGILRTANETKLRSQAYQGSREDNPNEIAQPHTDRSCITVHMCEDFPGLVIMPYGIAGPHYQIEARPGRVIVFAGTQMTKMTGGAIKALLHGACLVNTSEKPWPGERHMAVLFAKGYHNPNDNPYNALPKRRRRRMGSGILD